MSEKKCTACMACDFSGEQPPCRTCDASNCNWQPKEPEQANDFSRAEVGQELWSLRYGLVKVDRVTKTHIHCMVSSRGNTVYTWFNNGVHYSNDAYTDLFWRKPEIEFIPDPVRMVEKDIFVNIFECGGIVVTKYDDESTARAAENANDCKYYKTAHKITIEVEE